MLTIYFCGVVFILYVLYSFYWVQASYHNSTTQLPDSTVLTILSTERVDREGVRGFIQYNMLVHSVKYNPVEDKFTVVTNNLADQRRTETRSFTHVLVATGHYSFPFVPEYDGFSTFPGRITHAHDFRNGAEYKDKNVLIVGSSFSAEDISIHCIKYGAQKVICTWLQKPTGLTWPDGIEEREMITKIDGQTAHFRDGSEAEVDTIILCTGYVMSFPFMDDDIRLDAKQSFFPHGLYKGISLMKGGNGKVFYLGLQNTLYTFNMFDTEAELACGYVAGDISLPSPECMKMDHDVWIEKLKKAKNILEFAAFQRDYVKDIRNILRKENDLSEVYSIIIRLIDHRMKCISTFREESFTSIFTGQRACGLSKPWMEEYDDTLENYLKYTD